RRATPEVVPEPGGRAVAPRAVGAADARSHQQLQGVPPRVPPAHADREPGGIRPRHRVDGEGALRRRTRGGGPRGVARPPRGEESLPPLLVAAALPSVVPLGASPEVAARRGRREGVSAPYNRDA